MRLHMGVSDGFSCLASEQVQERDMCWYVSEEGGQEDQLSFSQSEKEAEKIKAENISGKRENKSLEKRRERI